MQNIRTLIVRIYSIPLLLLLWQLGASMGWITSRLLPSPATILNVFWIDLSNGLLLSNAMVTVGRAMSGFFIAVVLGTLMAALMARSRLFGRLFEPLFFIGYPVPKIALFPIFTFMFGIGSSSKIAFTVLECLYPIVVTTYLGIRGIQTRLIWTAQNMGAGPMTILHRVVIPAALPSIFAGLRIALPLAMVIVVVTEMIGDTQGLGYYITIYSTRFRYANVYAGIMAIGICGFMLDMILLWIRQRVLGPGNQTTLGR